MKLVGKIVLLWGVETLLNALAGAVWAYQDKYNYTSILSLFAGALQAYGSLKAVFYLPLYLLAYFTILKEVVLGNSVAELLRCHLILFSGISFITGTVFFAWNLFYNDFLLAGLLLASSALAVLATGWLLLKQ